MRKLNSFLMAAGLLAAAASAQAATLYSNGPVVGSNGFSVIDPSNTTYGLSALAPTRVAEDFTIGANETWTIQNINFFAYQTNSTTFTLTSATWSIVSGDVNAGTVVASGTTALTSNGLLGYRVSGTSTDTLRGIWSATADVTDFSLGAGNYWLTWSLAGSSSFTGPWVPLTSDGIAGNAMQYTATTGAFGLATDTNTGVSFTLPFQLNGVVSSVPEPAEVTMLLAGMGVLALVARRRKTRV